MKHVSIAILAGLLLAAAASKLQAYEVPVHARITNEAYKKYVLADPQFLKRFGLENGEDPFGSTYYDYQVSPADVREWTADDYEESDERMPKDAEPLSIEGWLMRGAIREDDFVSGYKILGILCYVEADNPQDQDPYDNDPDRPLNHFFNPVNTIPLTVLGSPRGQMAPDWALGRLQSTAATFNQPLNPTIENPSRRNHFTIFDAIEYQYRAMTGHYTDGSSPLSVLTKDDRKAYWASTFRALGDVVHLVQDMAQPQHTRNDAHSGVCFRPISGLTSVYEKYTEASALGKKLFSIDGTSIEPPALKYTGYNPPVFDQYGNYWSTGNGEGLAEFSNREFYSAGSNAGKTDFTSPTVSELFDLSQEMTIKLKEADGGELPTNVFPRTYQVKLKARTVHDLRTGEMTVTPVTTENLWEQLIGKAETPQKRLSYSLNRFNYNAMAASLIPRAVGYSVGLIDHFFRGRLQIMQGHKIGDSLSISFKNLSADDAGGNGIMFSQGEFEVYYESIDGSMQNLALLNCADCSDLPSGTALVGADAVVHDQIYTLKFEHPPEDDIAEPAVRDSNGNKTGVGTDTPFVLIFRGLVGQEYGLAAVAFPRGGLLALYNPAEGAAERFTVQVAADPSKDFRPFSDGPPELPGMEMGPGTILGQGKLLIDGRITIPGGDKRSRLFYSFDEGRIRWWRDLEYYPWPQRQTRYLFRPI